MAGVVEFWSILGARYRVRVFGLWPAGMDVYLYYHCM